MPVSVVFECSAWNAQAWLVADFEARWADPASRENIMRVARLLEEESSVIGASAQRS